MRSSPSDDKGAADSPPQRSNKYAASNSPARTADLFNRTKWAPSARAISHVSNSKKYGLPKWTQAKLALRHDGTLKEICIHVSAKPLQHLDFAGLCGDMKGRFPHVINES